MEVRTGPATSREAMKRGGDHLGIHPGLLRTRVRQTEVDGAFQAGTTADGAARILEAERKVREP